MVTLLFDYFHVLLCRNSLIFPIHPKNDFFLSQNRKITLIEATYCVDLPYILIPTHDVPAWVEDGITNLSYSHAARLTVQTNCSHLLSQYSYTNAGKDHLC